MDRARAKAPVSQLIGDRVRSGQATAAGVLQTPGDTAGSSRYVPLSTGPFESPASVFPSFPGAAAILHDGRMRRRSTDLGSHVHALHSHRPGLMGRVSHQPATSLPESPAHPGLKLHFGDPVNFADGSPKPGSPFPHKFLHLTARLQLDFRLIHHDHASIL